MRFMPAQTVHLGVAVAAWTAALGGFTDRSPVQKRVVPAPPQAVRVVVTSADHVVTYPDERWQLHGDGTPESPYYWDGCRTAGRHRLPQLRCTGHQGVRNA
jgi:hypothetical protein